MERGATYTIWNEQVTKPGFRNKWVPRLGIEWGSEEKRKAKEKKKGAEKRPNALRGKLVYLRH